MTVAMRVLELWRCLNTIRCRGDSMISLPPQRLYLLNICSVAARRRRRPPRPEAVQRRRSAVGRLTGRAVDQDADKYDGFFPRSRGRLTWQARGSLARCAKLTGVFDSFFQCTVNGSFAQPRTEPNPRPGGRRGFKPVRIHPSALTRK